MKIIQKFLKFSKYQLDGGDEGKLIWCFYIPLIRYVDFCNFEHVS